MHSYKDLDSFEYWSITDKDQFSIAVLKGLVMDGVRKANSGHPGGAMSSADFIYLLFKDYIKFNPNDPSWFDRDRFILSGGHMSMLQYGILHMLGWMKISDLKKFRQLGSQTPGHPEVEIKASNVQLVLLDRALQWVWVWPLQKLILQILQNQMM